MALKQVKSKILATQKTGKVTKAMEAVSAVKMRKSQERALGGKAYAEAAIRILMRISKSRSITDFFVKRDSTEKECIVVITSDKGLAGSLNSAVLKEVDLYCADKDTQNIHIVAYGRKAYEHFLRKGTPIDAHYLNVSDEVSIEDMSEVVTLIHSKFSDNQYGKISVAYQSFVSTFEQQAVLRQVLPLDSLVLETMVRDIVPKRGQYSTLEKDLENHVYTVEPSVEEVALELVPRLVQIMIYHALLENKASEHSARMVAMKNATDKSRDMVKGLTLIYNKERQAAITAEVSEITGGIEAMQS